MRIVKLAVNCDGIARVLNKSKFMDKSWSRADTRQLVPGGTAPFWVQNSSGYSQTIK